MKRVALLSAALLLSVTASFGSGVLVEAESFRDKGGWAVDQQFMDQMGSPYLIAHGMGKPVADAVTTVEFPETGTYRVYVRTFNWVAPWYDGEGPGKFALRVGSRKLSATLGCTGSEWMWQCAGKVSVRKGPVSVGGGIAGMCAAAAASRLGCSVALVNDRPVLGGNNSSEVRVHLGGVIELGPNEGLGRMIREFGHSREGNARPAENYEDAKKSAFIAGEQNVKLFSSCRAVAVNKEGGRIKSVIVRHIETGEETTLEAPLFADCTGDGTVGFLAGADYRMGRESRDEFGETLAPETADRMTMGSSVQWYSVDTGRKTSFPTFSYGVEFNAENCERVTMGEWKWETGMNLDQIRDFERIRDYGLLVIYSNWSFLKNGLKDNAKYRNRELGWVAYVAGKRESRRLLGDYVLKQDDIDKNVFHEDASFTATWDIDLHFPDSLNSVRFPDREFKAATKHIHIYPHAVPYRCLYSRNVDNLFMAGRNISVTHVALGTVRVMRTTGMMGEVVGMAASLCRKYDASPRLIYQKHLGELRRLMREGVGRKERIPNNQKFNQGASLKAPRALRND